MKTRKQKLILFSKIFLAIFALIIVLFFFFRATLLQQAIAKVSRKIDKEYNCKFSVKEAKFDGITGIDLSEIALVPKNADTIFSIQKMNTSVSFWHLLVGKIQLGTLKVSNGFVQLINNEKGKNFQAFLNKKQKNTSEISSEKRNYSELTFNIISKALNLIPTDMKLQNLIFKLDDKGKKATINIVELVLINKQLDTNITVKTDTFAQRWRIKGFADPRNNKTDISFFNLDTGAIRMPYFEERFNLKSSFDSIRLNVENIDMDGDELHIDGFSTVFNLRVNHPKIASKDVILKNAQFDYHFLIGTDFISVDSTSTVAVNKIKIHPYLAFDTQQDTIFKFKVNIPKMKAQDFISSLPDGLFSNFQGMEAEGSFAYQLNFIFNKNKPKELLLDSNLDKENLKITKFGAANLNKLNGEFVYRAIIKNVEQRPVLVGNANPNYTPLNQISPYLRKCVLTTEDPSFFSHHGFILEAFRQSIIQNIKTKQFSRGASTISMQLIKNVFLTRQKTLSRKLEEILLVYVLENSRITTKERILEVYFNIIEWGPNVYGIGEASYFYFQKSPSQLTLNECIYLANIIPSPKKFMYQFNEEGNLKSFALAKQKFLTNLMMRRGILSMDDTIYKSQPVLISGNAKSFIRLRVKDTIAIDSLNIDEEFEF